MRKLLATTALLAVSVVFAGTAKADLGVGLLGLGFVARRRGNA